MNDPHISRVLVSEAELQARVAELGRQITADYAEHPPLLVGVLKGAFVFMADLARAIDLPVDVDFMAVSSYGSATRSSGVVRIVKDLDSDRGRELTDQLYDLYNEGIEADPEEEFHRAIQRMNVQYTCSFEENEGAKQCLALSNRDFQGSVGKHGCLRRLPDRIRAKRSWHFPLCQQFEGEDGSGAQVSRRCNDRHRWLEFVVLSRSANGHE